MAKKPISKKITEEQKVEEYAMKVAPEIKNETDLVRSIIKKANPGIKERIKWNNYSYYYHEDIVTFGPRRDGHKVMLVFHHPSVVKVTSEWLEGDYKDRRLVYLKDDKAIKAAKNELTRIVKEIISYIDAKG